ncbi:uncharacterized protein TNCT_53901, partial [Trichonephila clavata]
VIPVHAVRASTPSHRERRSSKSRNSHRLSYKVSSMASDGIVVFLPSVVGFLRIGQNFRDQSDSTVLLDTMKTILSLHSGDESENETTYIFNREVPASYLDTHEMSEAECDRDLHEFCEKTSIEAIDSDSFNDTLMEVYDPVTQISI